MRWPQQHNGDKAKALPDIGDHVRPREQLAFLRRLPEAIAVEVVAAQLDEVHAGGRKRERNKDDPTDELRGMVDHADLLCRRPTSSAVEPIGSTTTTRRLLTSLPQ